MTAVPVQGERSDGEGVGRCGGPWTGAWVSERLAVTVPDTPGPGGAPAVSDLVGLAVRRNPRRAHLLVSRVLGKHVPTDPRVVRAAGLVLGHRVAAALRCAPDPHPAAPDPAADLAAWLRADPAGPDSATLRDRAVSACAAEVTPPCLVLGYAETATGLGHVVADALDAAYVLHSTRRRDTGVPEAGGFAEAHSHAAEHLLLPADPAALASADPLVLVDDELSTGRTAAATIRTLHRLASGRRARYLVAALVDVRDATEHDDLARVAAELGVTVEVVALAAGPVGWSADTARRGAEVVTGIDAGVGPTADASDGVATGASPVDSPSREPATRGTESPGPGSARNLPVAPRVPATPTTTIWAALPGGVAEGARHGLDRAGRAALAASIASHVEAVASELGEPGARVLVLGTEELMYLPLRLAEGLADRLGERAEVVFSSTTRSPVLAVDDPGYAIRSATRFRVHEAGSDPGERYAYNLDVGGEPWDAVVLVVDDGTRTAALHGPGGLVPALTGSARRVLEVVVPAVSAAPAPAGPPAPLRGPRFGSYRPGEVGWLLTDLSAVPLEAPTSDRERAQREGRAHYAESLPIEYQPSPEYRALFDAGLARAAPRMADAVARVTDDVLRATGPDTVLVSLARAGTPIGVLMRRWAAHAHGFDLPHYAVSIVRGRGIDATALDALATWHDPASVCFVDGWTGKGAIVDELAAALADRPEWDPTVAVLADPAHATTRHGTREDFLVPSACLNSTVSGLVSRTVLRADLVPPGGYHGAKSYAELAASDVSATFVDTVAAQFPAVSPSAAGPTEPPDRRGLHWARALATELGVDDLNRVKPGVGETTRVLLRRMPGVVLVHPDAGVDVEHVLLLARDRDVPVRALPEHLGGVEGPYRCVGVIGA